jgi:hypothetical protein
MRLRPANIRLINRRKSYLDRYSLYLRNANNPCNPTSKSTARINKKGIDSSLHIRNFMRENRETSEMPAAKVRRRTAGEGSGHTARMYVCEESDGGILPMNHSKQDGKPSAESEEGRLLIKENTLSSSTHPTQSGSARVPRGRVCGQATRLAATHLREEPDALMNARPGLCGGHRADWCPYRDQQQSFWATTNSTAFIDLPVSQT